MGSLISQEVGNGRPSESDKFWMMVSSEEHMVCRCAPNDLEAWANRNNHIASVRHVAWVEADQRAEKVLSLEEMLNLLSHEKFDSDRETRILRYCELNSLDPTSILQSLRQEEQETEALEIQEASEIEKDHFDPSHATSTVLAAPTNVLSDIPVQQSSSLVTQRTEEIEMEKQQSTPLAAPSAALGGHAPLIRHLERTPLEATAAEPTQPRKRASTPAETLLDNQSMEDIYELLRPYRQFTQDWVKLQYPEAFESQINRTTRFNKRWNREFSSLQGKRFFARFKLC
jgi:hypothetical protein